MNYIVYSRIAYLCWFGLMTKRNAMPSTYWHCHVTLFWFCIDSTFLVSADLSLLGANIMAGFVCIFNPYFHCRWAMLWTVLLVFSWCRDVLSQWLKVSVRIKVAPVMPLSLAVAFMIEGGVWFVLQRRLRHPFFLVWVPLIPVAIFVLGWIRFPCLLARWVRPIWLVCQACLFRCSVHRNITN